MTHAPPETAQTPARGRLKDHGDVEPLRPLRVGYCDYCRERIDPTAYRPGMRFCNSTCRTDWWKMARNRGAQLYHHLTVWRMHRGRKGTPGAGVFSRISATIDMWARKDRGGA
ncbi:hypothetical protein [Aestuariivita sp.]|uniref:hypothetical protein n=1 Tax=Aestuariivita sp. TaxID=1872407 RepID=UPI00216C4AB6|nr:hypothetical protein [Aestuariivita sp.]MCE8006427.1 hypothetical protein [Aestuariivita sp.]